jgi:hypothetical protein
MRELLPRGSTSEHLVVLTENRTDDPPNSGSRKPTTPRDSPRGRPPALSFSRLSSWVLGWRRGVPVPAGPPSGGCRGVVAPHCRFPASRHGSWGAVTAYASSPARHPGGAGGVAPPHTSGHFSSWVLGWRDGIPVPARHPGGAGGSPPRTRAGTSRHGSWGAVTAYPSSPARHAGGAGGSPPRTVKQGGRGALSPPAWCGGPHGRSPRGMFPAGPMVSVHRNRSDHCASRTKDGSPSRF